MNKLIEYFIDNKRLNYALLASNPLCSY